MNAIAKKLYYRALRIVKQKGYEFIYYDAGKSQTAKCDFLNKLIWLPKGESELKTAARIVHEAHHAKTSGIRGTLDVNKMTYQECYDWFANDERRAYEKQYAFMAYAIDPRYKKIAPWLIRERLRRYGPEWQDMAGMAQNIKNANISMSKRIKQNNECLALGRKLNSPTPFGDKLGAYING